MSTVRAGRTLLHRGHEKGTSMVLVRQIPPAGFDRHDVSIPRAGFDRHDVSTGFFRFYLTVVVIQGIHVIEHVIQLLQVTVFHVPDDDALGLLGYFLQLHGTEEWLHFGFNLSYLVSLYALVLLLHERVESGVVPKVAFSVFLVAGAGLESWHLIEHIVIIHNALRNGGGCPCPGIGDRALNISDTYLHFVYNIVAYAGTVTPFWFIYKRRVASGTEFAYRRSS